MPLLGRIIVIVFAVMVASMAAGIAIAMGVLGPQWHGFSGDIGERVGFWMLAFAATSFTGAVGLLPLAIMIAIAEREVEIAAAAGVVFGLVYWAIAGRRAGRWRERM